MKPYFFRIIVLFFTFFVHFVWGQSPTKKSGFYDFLWGKHYRELYHLSDFATQKQDTIAQNYRYFRYFPEFEKLYEKDQFEGTYTDIFLTDAYTLIHPISSEITDKLAQNIELFSENIEEKRFTTSQVIQSLEENFTYKIDENKYVRSRLLDMIVGNSLSVNDSYLWKKSDENPVIYEPYQVDRGFSFAKKDGFFYGALLNSLGIKNIPNYYSKNLNINTINFYNYVLDLTFSDRIKEQIWLEQAVFIKEKLTKNVIDEIFAELPENVQNAQSNQDLKTALLYRVSTVNILAQKYYKSLQKTAVVRGTAQDDRFEIVQNKNTTTITVKNWEGQTIFKNEYFAKKTKEIWLYGFAGVDEFSLEKIRKNNIKIRIINNDIYNEYDLKKASKKVKIYTTKQATLTKNEVGKAAVFKTDNPSVLEYRFDRPKRQTLGFQPSILLDTDLAIRLGGTFIYTQYAFKNQPFSAKHELGWNHYLFSYLGVFPTLNEKFTYTTSTWLASADYFQNFFGFGNESENYESSFGRDYNRVFLQRFGGEAGVIFKVSQTQKAMLKTEIERFNIIDDQKFHRDDIFQENELKNKANFFLNIKGNYQILSLESKNNKLNYTLIPEIGLMVNFRDMNRNVPYLSGMFSFKFNPDFDRKHTLATYLKAKTLFNKTYEFYQAATMGGETGLRGYRNERFSGQHYFVHSTDFRINVGTLTNKIVPLNFEPFFGFDYGRVWYSGENSQKWHTSVGGGLSFRIINTFSTNISYFTSSEKPRITLSLGYFF